MSGNALGLYIHIPFCRSKCRYCGFLSVPCKEVPESYVDGLCQEILLYREGAFHDIPIRGDRDAPQFLHDSVYRRYADSIFLGGGTPSLLTERQLERILWTLNTCFETAGDTEITLEGNPESLTKDKLRAYRRTGVDRLSIGLQAIQPEILTRLGRIHTTEDFLNCYGNARAAGFENISVDVMFGLPGQTMEDWEETLSFLTDLSPEHLSCYSLQLEEGTPFYDSYRKGELLLPSDEEERAMHRLAMERLTAAGDRHYEISNFAREGYGSRHNRKYWRMAPFLGFGWGAASFLNGVRFRDESDPEKWERALMAGRLPIRAEEGEVLRQEPLKDQTATYVFTGLRESRGIRFDEFREYFGRDFWSCYGDLREYLAALGEKGLIRLSGEGFSLTRDGIDRSNEIMARFLK